MLIANFCKPHKVVVMTCVRDGIGDATATLFTQKGELGVKLLKGASNKVYIGNIIGFKLYQCIQSGTDFVIPFLLYFI
jgi:hypothetical protein